MIEKIFNYIQTKEFIFAVGILIFFLFFCFLLQILRRKKSKKQPLESEPNSVSIGREGEAEVASILAKIPSKQKRLIYDIVLKNRDEKTTQIDHIFINEAGIFVIETKNYKGLIYGTAEGLHWYQYLNGKKFNFYNPLRQNTIHINRLKEILGDTYPYYSVVVFVKNDLKKINFENVIQAKDLEAYILSHHEKALSRAEIKQIYQALSSIQKKHYFHVFHQENEV